MDEKREEKKIEEASKRDYRKGKERTEILRKHSNMVW